MKIKITAALVVLLAAAAAISTARRSPADRPGDLRDAPSDWARSEGPADIPDVSSPSPVASKGTSGPEEGTPCYMGEEPCSRLTSFYIVRKLTLKYGGNCSKLPIRLTSSPPGEVDWCNKLKKLYDKPDYLPSELEEMCEKVHSNENMTSGDRFLDRIPGANVLVRESMKASKANCKTVSGTRSWYDSKLEVHYYDKPEQVVASDDHMPVNAVPTGYNSKMITYVGNTLDNKMTLQIVCERKKDAWRIAHMSMISPDSGGSALGLGVNFMFLGLELDPGESGNSSSVQQVPVQGYYCGGSMDTQPLPGR